MPSFELGKGHGISTKMLGGKYKKNPWKGCHQCVFLRHHGVFSVYRAMTLVDFVPSRQYSANENEILRSKQLKKFGRLDILEMCFICLVLQQNCPRSFFGDMSLVLLAFAEAFVRERDELWYPSGF